MNQANSHSIVVNKAIAGGVLLVLIIVIVAGIDVTAKSESRDHEIEITNFAFVPATVDARVGDTITWINRDIVPHTATGEDDSWDTGSINSNESKSLVVTAEMVSDYFCRFHPTMKGAFRGGPE